MKEPLIEPEDILFLWQSQYGQLDEEMRNDFLESEIVEELCYYEIDLIQNAILAKNLRLKDILTYVYVHPKLSASQVSRLETERLIPEPGAYIFRGNLCSIRRDRKTDQIQAWIYKSDKKIYERPFFSADEREIIYSLSTRNRLTLQLAQKYSIETGICCHCGRYLSAKKSIANGMGPICKKHYH